MGIADYALLALIHPIEFRSLIQYKLWHEQQRDLTATKEHANSGWDRESMRECWDFLDRTSRSFAAVIKQLDGDLARTVSINVISASPRNQLTRPPYTRSVFSTSSSADLTPSRMT